MRLSPCIYVAIFLTLIWSNFVLAKEITLYDQPKADAKSVGKIDLNAGVIPIFTPKDGTWVKVADPRNGNVGWIKTNEIDSNSVTYSQKVINDGNTTRTTPLLQFGQPSPATDAETQARLQKLRQQQEEVQKAVQNMLKNFGSFYQEQYNKLNNSGAAPIIMPIVIMPPNPVAPAVNQPAVKPSTMPPKQTQ